MTDFIKFDLLHTSQGTVTKRKQPSRLFIYSLVVVVALAGGFAGFFLYLESKEPGRQVEEARPIDETHLRTETEPVRQFHYALPEGQIESVTREENIQNISNIIVSRRSGWQSALSKISGFKADIKSITSYHDFGLFFDFELDSLDDIDSILAYANKDTLIFKKQYSDSVRGLVLIEIPKTDATEKTLEVVIPPFFGTKAGDVTKLFEKNKLKVSESQILGNTTFDWGVKHNFVVSFSGTISNLQKTLTEIAKREDMLDIDAITIEIDKLEETFENSVCSGKIIFALYNVLGIVE